MSGAVMAEEVRHHLQEHLDYHYREIVEESAIDPEVALERGYYLEKTKKGLERLGFTRRQQRVPAIVIPRYSPSGEEIAPQIKPDNPCIEDRKGKIFQRKYESVAGATVRLSVHPRTIKVLRDIRYPLWITEGDKKGDALVSHAAAAVVLQGVTCWNVPCDWEDIKLYGREVIVAFDADVMINAQVQRELEKLTAFLQGRGAKVKFLRWTEAYRGTKIGVDDYLAAGNGTAEDLYRMSQEAPDEEAIPFGVAMADIEPETVEWLWKRRIPRGNVTVWDGDPGTGKSLSLYDLAARITSGKPMPDGQPIERAGALIVSAEDGAADTIVPRFMAAGGDPTKARIIGSAKPFIIPNDLDKLERVIRQTGASFVAIDPIMSFLSDDVNSNRDQDVRRALQPLVDVAHRTNAAIVVCRHLNKSVGGQSLYRGQGSIGFIGIARSGLLAGKHPERDGMFVLAGQKHNLSKPPKSLAYRIKDAAPGNETAVIEYLGPSEVTAQQITSPPEDEGERAKLSEAKEFLRNILRGGPEFTKKIKAEATGAEIGWRTVERAKGQLKIQAVKDPDSGRWMWTLSGPPEKADDGRQDDVGGLGGDGGHGPTSTTTTTDNKSYTKEDRQDRQDRQRDNGNVHADTASEDRQDRQALEDDWLVL